MIVPMNVDESGNAVTINAGYYKYYLASFFRYGTSGTVIVEMYEDSD